MTIEVELPDHLPRAELDRRLAGGWFRSGPLLFRAPVLHVDDALRDLVHVRIRLDVDPPSKRRRRLLRRNRERFRTVVQPARVDDARRALYRLTRERFVGFVVTDLDVIALGDQRDVYDTREVAVYDGDRLVAIGYFDVGKRAVASILGLHDPAYAKRSLGIYTMLEEMAVARDHGARWYYPGYVVPGLPGFDYKLRLGAVQYRDGQGRWRARVHPPAGSPRAEHATARMEAMMDALRRRGVPYVRRIYPALWLGYMNVSTERFLRGMWHLRIGVEGELVVEQLADGDTFVVAEARALPQLDPFENFEPDPELESLCERRVLAYARVRASGASIEGIADHVAAFVRRATP